MERRALMKWAIRGFGLATATMVGGPSLIASFAPLWSSRPRAREWRTIGAIGELPVGEIRKISVSLPDEPWGGGALRELAVYAWRRSEQDVIGYSRSCTDLGCPLTFDPGSQCFFCPCHGGIFDKNGARMAGPPRQRQGRRSVGGARR